MATMKRENADNKNSAWIVERLRFTAFPSPSQQMGVPPSDWWEKTVGESPSKSNFERRKSQLIEEGSYKDNVFILSVQPSRIDWMYNPRLEGEVSQAPSLGPFDDTVVDFLNLLERWLSVADIALKRIAFGAILLLNVDNVTAGYKELQKYLGKIVNIDTEKSRDFFYQINRRRPSASGVKELEINRLNKWSVQSANIAQLSFGGDVGPRVVNASSQSLLHLELDINTSQNFAGELPRDKCKTILKELVDLGKEISIKGDIP